VHGGLLKEFCNEEGGNIGGVHAKKGVGCVEAMSRRGQGMGLEESLLRRASGGEWKRWGVHVRQETRGQHRRGIRGRLPGGREVRLDRVRRWV